MITIRDAKTSDAKILCDAEKQIAATPGLMVSLPDELNEASFADRIQKLSQLPNSKYIVAEINGKIVGHALLDPMPLKAIQHVARLTIMVHPTHEEKGIGTEMLKHLISWTQTSPHVEKIELNVRSVNLRAIRLYQKFGFNVESRLKNRVKTSENNYIDDLQMGLFLKKNLKVKTFVAQPIGIVASTRKEILDNNWDGVQSYIEVDSQQFDPEALAGLDSFSHVEVIYHMDQVDVRKIEATSRHPRNNLDWPKVGIFSQRGKNRPNQIGLAVCEILKVDGLKLHLKDLDAVDGTPVLDIKPWMREFGPKGSIRQPEWSQELMKDYWNVKSISEPDMFAPVVIDTEHVKIRPLKTVTWQKLSEGLLYEGSFHATNWGIKTPDDVRKMYENSLSAFQAKRGNPIVFLNKNETEVVGITNFMNVEPANKMIEIGGTWINKKYQRTFVNTETKFALLQYAFETLKLNRVEFRIDSDNFISQKAVRRLGIHFDGLMPRRKINANGQVRDYVFYSVTDQSWPQVKNQIKQVKEKSKLPEFSLIQKIKVLLRENKADQAYDSVLSATVQFPNSAYLQYLAGCICDAHKTEAEAVPFYLRSLELGLSGLDRRNALLGLGSTYRSLGKYEESKKTFETGIKEFPEYRPYYIFLALTEFNLQQSDQSIKRLLEQIIETSSDQEIRSYEKALKFYSIRLSEVFE